MVREDRYFVLKRKDMNACLTDTEQDILFIISHKIMKHRKETERDHFKCVVVEDDWPEFEKVWAMIEARVGGTPETQSLGPELIIVGDERTLFSVEQIVAMVRGLNSLAEVRIVPPTRVNPPNLGHEPEPDTVDD